MACVPTCWCSTTTSPATTGSRIATASRARPHPPAVVIYSAYPGPALTVAARAAQADGVIDKAEPVPTLVAAVRRVANGEVVMPPIPRHVFEAAVAKLDDDDLPVFAMLLDREPHESIAHALRAEPAEIARRARRIVRRLRPQLGAAVDSEVDQDRAIGTPPVAPGCCRRLGESAPNSPWREPPPRTTVSVDASRRSTHPHGSPRLRSRRLGCGRLRWARIVVAYDGFQPAKRALERAAALADDRTLIVVVAVAEPYHRSGVTIPANLDPAEARRRHHDLDETRALLSERGLSVETLQVRGDPASALVEAAPTPTWRSSGAQVEPPPAAVPRLRQLAGRS